MRTNTHPHGKHEIRTQPNADGSWTGVANLKRNRVAGPVTTATEQQTIAALRNAIDVEHPDFHGMDEAIARFLRIYPGGFIGSAYREAKAERVYKDKAIAALHNALPLSQAKNASSDQAKALVATSGLWIALPHTTETARLRDTLRGATSADFVHGAAELLDAEDDHHINAVLARMAKAVKPHGDIRWPIITYLPFLWAPERAMFIKPEAQLAFAARVGDAFQHDYSPETSSRTWHASLALAQRTKNALDAAGLAPADNVDVQSFIWVVAKYAKEREVA